MCTHTQALRTHASCMHAHAKVPKTIKDKSFAFKLNLEQIPYCLGAILNPLFFDYIKSYNVLFERRWILVEKHKRFTRK